MTESMEPAHGLPVAGWYVDPLDAGVLRYWDGAAWTAHARPVEDEPEPERAPKHRLGLAAVLGIIASTALLGVALVAIAALAQREAMAADDATDRVVVETTTAQTAAEPAAPSGRTLAKRARRDLEELGVTVVTAFADRPDATVDVTQVDGDYVVLADGTEYARIEVAEGVELGDFVAGGADSFCVWVTTPANGKVAHWSPLDVADEDGRVDRSGGCADVVR
ncbi:DUF2510 domain-containing protein [Demequina sp. SYSU T00192]|uniref:DUF2510 domain-containing protein n=1 Tax=Demequina litoralis TaxID=3051660 RepID=A0ABT8G9B6_9MICO|nr:DUF2510 domain-containing protein [Demequina sp. SYSU T00192]MDN4475738.1 DUF2510 domain-containing protein [Demequina sp. SYSU T00192]